MDTRQALRQVEALLRERKYANAQAVLLGVLKTDPKSAEAHYQLGAMAYQQGALPRAVEAFEEAGRLDPKDPRYPMRAGAALLAGNRVPEARAAADRAAALNPKDPLVLDSLGVLYSRVGAFDQGVTFARRAVAAAPSDPNYLFNLGWAEQYSGDLAAAAAAFRRVVGLRPEHERAWLALVEIEKQTPESNGAAPLQKLYAAAGGQPDRVLAIGHALAKVHEDLGDYQTSLDWLERAKAPRRRAQAFDTARMQATFASAAATWTNAGSPASGEGFNDARPIFVIGLPRTGTTLVDRILSSHPDVASAGELKAFPILAKRASGVPSRSLADAETLRRAAQANPRGLGLDYAAAAHPVAGPSPRFIDKLPFNFFYAGLILRALPQARIICLRRDPMDSCLSNYRQAFGVQSDFHDYVFSLEDVAHYYVAFDRLIAHWRAVLPADRFTEIAYEDLIANQEAETRRLLDFCDLSWDPRCLDFHENRAGVSTASAAQVRQPLYSGSVGRWRRYGERLEPVATILREAGISV